MKYVNVYSGYIFIKMDMTDKAWFVIRNTQYVTGLIGSSGKGSKPTPVSESQIKKATAKEQEYFKDFEDGKTNDKFTIGEIVEIIDGPFKGTSGVVIEFSNSSEKAIVEIEYFGKKVPTDFSYSVLKSQEK
ncbi:Transcription antitermination protein nusG [Mycoplasmopsis maculosa]|uniref:Transcription termination/antitermination protein NusG n=1 Tax=Mycoplasmopsis maculosa TaxID=114885 RepID=A0A449B535_9BACT|nr:transcription termination/antitermination protein NusG [Mycoplasmopsis maculosa]VEU75638.1 Transcription antitermination protein nusG [Mycoplasmopsis maculosa]